MRSILFRSAFAAILASAMMPIHARPQSQDSQSVAEAARRAREKKKDAAAKPAKVITDETLDVKKGDVQSAAAEEAKVAGTPDANTQTGATASANAGAKSSDAANENPNTSATAQAAKTEKLKKELAALQEQLKIALTDLDLLRRENRLDQDTYYSKTNYASDTAGKQKLDNEVQHIADKQQEVENLKTKIADLEKAISNS